MTQLPDNQEQFVTAYLSHFDARRAAVDAGYSAGNYAYNLMKSPALRREIQRRVMQAVDHAAASSPGIIAGLVRIAENMNDKYTAANQIRAARVLAEIIGIIGAGSGQPSVNQINLNFASTQGAQREVVVESTAVVQDPADTGGTRRIPGTTPGGPAG